MTRVSHGIDRVDVIFDEPNLVANAGLLLVATLSARLELEALIDATVRLVGRIGGARPGRKVLTLVHAMIAGASHIDHADMLRAGSTAGVLSHRVMAPSTLGTFLRAFTFGHVRQLEAVIGRVLERAWAAGAGPGDAPLVIDVDSTICPVDGKPSRVPGSATRTCSAITRSSPREPTLVRCCTPGCARARPTPSAAPAASSTNSSPGSAAPAPPVPSLSASTAGFWSNDTITTLNRLDVRYTMAVRCGVTTVAAAIAAIPDEAWVDIDYPDGGQAQVADTTYTTGAGRRQSDSSAGRAPHPAHRQRPATAVAGLAPPRLPHRPDDDAVSVDAFHRHHAVVELAIRDLKEGAGLDHVPSGNFHANSAWLQCAVLAHNLIRWTAILGEVRVNDELTVARTMRTRLISLPGRLVNRAGRPTLRLPERWPWADTFTTALASLRLLRPVPT